MTITTTIWTHNGIVITFDVASAMFRFEIDGKTKRASSLDAAKAQIDKIRKSGFQPFTAFECTYYTDDYRKNGGITKVEVIGIEKGGRHSYGHHQFKVKTVEPKGRHDFRREYETQYVHPESEEFRAAYRAFMDRTVAHKLLKAEMDRAESELKRLIPVISADDYIDHGAIHVKVPAKGDPAAPDARLSDHETEQSSLMIVDRAAYGRMLAALKAVDSEGLDATKPGAGGFASGDVVIRSEIWDLVQQEIAKAEGSQ